VTLLRLFNSITGSSGEGGTVVVAADDGKFATSAVVMGFAASVVVGGAAEGFTVAVAIAI